MAVLNVSGVFQAASSASLPQARLVIILHPGTALQAHLQKWFQKLLFPRKDRAVIGEDGAPLVLRTHLEREMQDWGEGPTAKG